MMMERYSKVEKLGEGAYGVVYKGKSQATGDLVAMKEIQLKFEDEGVPQSALREISLLKELSHPNIVTLRDVSNGMSGLTLIFELLDMDLKHHLGSNDRPLDPMLIKSYTLQMLRGLAFCHLRGVMHRDLKPANLLVTKDGALKIADFGLARAFCQPTRALHSPGAPFKRRRFAPHLTHEVVTLWYRPPEILLGSQTYAKPMDLWAIGTILVEMVTKKPMFPGDCEIDQLFHIFRVLGTPNEGVWQGVSNLRDYQAMFPVWPRLSLKKSAPGLDDDGLALLDACLRYTPKERISAKNACNHPYFDDLDKDAI